MTGSDDNDPQSVPLAVCDTCGDVHSTALVDAPCFDDVGCKGTYVRKDFIPIEELEALADEWEGIDTQEKPIHTAMHSGAVRAKRQCAQELREVIADYE